MSKLTDLVDGIRQFRASWTDKGSNEPLRADVADEAFSLIEQALEEIAAALPAQNTVVAAPDAGAGISNS